MVKHQRVGDGMGAVIAGPRPGDLRCTVTVVGVKVSDALRSGDILQTYSASTGHRSLVVMPATGRAERFTDRIIAHCLGLATFPERGTRRDDLRPGLRITTWRRRVVIAFHITPETVDRPCPVWRARPAAAVR